MHEISIAEELLKIIYKKAHEEGIRRISNINLRIGEYSGVFPDSLEFAFEVLSKGKLSEGAKLNIELVTPSFECQKCNSNMSMDNECCPKCGSEDIKLCSGDELQIISFEGD